MRGESGAVQLEVSRGWDVGLLVLLVLLPPLPHGDRAGASHQLPPEPRYWATYSLLVYAAVVGAGAATAAVLLSKSITPTTITPLPLKNF